MTTPATIARDSATHCEAKKHGLRQTQDGIVVSFVLHPGKGEVHSSILCGSTTKPNKISRFPRCSPALDVAIAQNEARNAQVKLRKKCGLCSVDVRS